MENVVHGNEKEICGHLESLVKESVEDTLNQFASLAVDKNFLRSEAVMFGE